MTQKARSARWHAKNKEKHRANVAAWKEANRDHANGYAREWRSRNLEAHLVVTSRSRAKVKGIEHTITEWDFVIPEVCPVLGIRLVRNSGTRTGAGPTIDRRDNSLGYVPGNVVVISHRANRLKADATLEEILAIARYMSQ